MRLEFDNKVQTSDGRDAGTVERLILDPECNALRAVVLHRGMLLGRSVEVPLQLLEPGPDSALRLTCTAEQEQDLQEFVEGSYTTPPPDVGAPLAETSDRFSWPLGPGVTAPPPTASGSAIDSAVRQDIAEAWRQQEARNAVLAAGSAVKNQDGEKVGTVHGLIVDPISGELGQIIVRTGFLSHADFEFPAELIAVVDDDVVHLNVPATEATA
jgi:sporulation protein YlmC with PRC-barrel domain